MNKGLMLIDKQHIGVWLTYLYKEYEKHCYLMDGNSTIADISNIIKEKELEYVIVPLSYDKEKIGIFKKLGIKVIVIIGDPMRRFGSQANKDYCIDNEIDGIILQSHTPIEIYRNWLDSDDIDFFYYKFGIPLDVFKDYGLEKTIDVSHTGKFSNYLYRRELHYIFSRTNELNYERFHQQSSNQTHPNYTYAKKLNSSWISIGGCCQQPYLAYYKGMLTNDLFPKNLEIAGSMSCLLTFDWGDREYLGFKDGENCILFKTLKDAVRKTIYYLDDKELLSKVTRNGYELVHKNHNVIDTVNQLFNDVEERYAK